MTIKLTLAGAATPSGTVDVEIDAPADVTVGALAGRLAERSPFHHGTAATLAAFRNGSAVLIEPSARLADAGILSGSTVELAARSTGAAPVPSTPADAVAVVTAGPGAGTRYPLERGTSIIGRDPSCDVVLDDPLASRRHARIELGDDVEVVDLGSVNGMLVDGSRVERARVGPNTDVMLGDTCIRLEMRRDDAPAGSTAFVRSPPAHVAFVADELTPPRVPTSNTGGGRIPVIAALAPVLLGAVMYAITRRVESLIFIALSPIMLIGNAVEARMSGRRGARRGAEQFRRQLDEFETDGRRRLAVESDARRREHPQLAELVHDLKARTPTLWSRRPDGEHFMEIAVGRATMPARTTMATPRLDDGRTELVEALEDVVQGLATVDDVPVTVDLGADGSIGVAGPRAQARGVAASMVASTVLFHSPAELTVALLSSEAAAPEWEWLKWLPHVDAEYAPVDTPRLTANTAGCARLHSGLVNLLDVRTGAAGRHQRTMHLPKVLVVIEDDAPIERSLLVDLLERGPSADIHTIWVASAIDRLPAGCGAVLDVTGGTHAMSLRVRRSKSTVHGISVAALPADELEHLGRELSPIVDIGARPRRESGLPDIVRGPELLDLSPSVPPELLLERWNLTSVDAARQGDTGLRAAVGIAGGEPFVLDLRAHGPHALVGGTTGAGKSEFLQSWVMGLAGSYSPGRVNFLFVDYKGGSAFSECVKLPHCVGLVTDLSPHLVDRALTSLHAELHRREHLFASLDAKDIHELERRGAPETPPALVIVVDEFAALVQEVPEFVNGVVNVAQRGRSLGLHLVLATQRPAGVITGNLRANTNLRVALRMADESDSTDVIDVGDAAFIDAAHPGRGFAKVGPGRTVAFQSAFYGGWSSRSSADQHVTVRPLDLDGGDGWSGRRSPSLATDEPNDLAKLVALAQRAALLGGVPTPRRPWLPELPADLDLRTAPITRSDGEIVFGTCDVPAHQAQPPISFVPDRDGNLAVFGAGGSGKSTLLRTIAMVAGSSIARPGTADGPCHVYCIDFGSRSLQALEEFPHVGAVIAADDHERIARLARDLRTMVDERQVLFRGVDADTIAQYREYSGDASVSRVLLMIDHFGAFRQAYEAPDRAATFETLLSIMADGRSVGVHVVLSADRPGAIPSAVLSLVPRRLVLRLANDNDALLLGERPDALGPASPPGRGVEQGREFQVAVLGGAGSLAEQTRLARALAHHDDFVGGDEPAPTVRRLPTLVRLDELAVAIEDRPTIGLDDATLAPVGFDPVGPFVVAGPPGSGRTTALVTIAATLGRWRPATQRVLFGQRRSPLLQAVPWTTIADRSSEHAELATAITADLNGIDGEVRGLAIFIENVTEALEAPDAEAALLELIKVGLAHDALVVVESEASLLVRAWKLDAVKNGRTGLLLQPQVTDGEILKVALPRVGSDRPPAGRGFLVARRELTKVQVAVADPDSA